MIHLINIKLNRAAIKQRIDSTHVIAKVRELSRLELLQETLRLFWEDAAYLPAENSIVDVAISRYIDQILDHRIVEGTRSSLIRDAGLAMRTLIESVEGSKITV